MKTYGGVEVQLHHSWPRHYMDVSGQLHTAAALPPGKELPDIHWIGGWVDPRAGLDAVKLRKISCSCQKLNPGRPVLGDSDILISTDRNLVCPIQFWTHFGFLDFPVDIPSSKIENQWQQSISLFQTILNNKAIRQMFTSTHFKTDNLKQSVCTSISVTMCFVHSICRQSHSNTNKRSEGNMDGTDWSELDLLCSLFGLPFSARDVSKFLPIYTSYIQIDSAFHIHRDENLKSHTPEKFYYSDSTSITGGFEVSKTVYFIESVINYIVLSLDTSDINLSRVRVSVTSN
jgi:hypothetical protein